MLTEFFMERAQIVLSADAERFIGTVPEFPELRVEAPTPEACERRLRGMSQAGRRVYAGDLA